MLPDWNIDMEQQPVLFYLYLFQFISFSFSWCVKEDSCIISIRILQFAIGGWERNMINNWCENMDKSTVTNIGKIIEVFSITIGILVNVNFEK